MKAKKSGNSSLKRKRSLPRDNSSKTKKILGQKTSRQKTLELAKVNEALKKSEAILKSVFSASPAGILLVTSDRKISWMNERITSITGYTLKDLQNKGPRIFYADNKEFARIGKAVFQKVLQGSTIEEDTLWTRKDGQKRNIHLSVAPIDPNNAALGQISIVTDITDQKVAEGSIRESENKLRDLTEKAIVGIYVAQGRLFRYVNEACAKIHGYEIDELINKKGPFDMMVPEDRHAHEKSIQQRITNHIKSAMSQFRIVRKSGETRYVETYGTSTMFQGKMATIGTIIDITDRKLAEEALRESENKFRDLVEKALVGVYVVQDRFFKYVNERCAQIHGCEIKELIDKKNPRDFILPEDLPIVTKNLQARMNGQIKSLGHEFRIVTKSGEIRYVETYGAHTMYQGKPATIGTIIDITERKQAEEALRVSEEQFRTLIEKSGGVISLIDTSRKRLYVSPSVKVVLGYSVEEYFAMKREDLFHPDESQILEKNRAWIREHPGETLNFVCRRRHKDGSWRWTENAVRNLTDDPNVRAVVINFHDITERKNAEEALKKSEEKYRNIFENAAEGIFQTTAEGKFISANPALARMHGYDSPDELMRNVNSIADQLYVDPGDREKLIKLLEEQSFVKAFQTKMYRRDGSVIWISLTSHAAKDAMGKIVYHEGVIEDITERKATESKLLESEERYRTAIERSNDGVALVRNGRYIYVNQKFLDIFGYEKPDDIIGRYPSATAHPDDIKKIEEFGVKRQRKEVVPERYEYKAIKKDCTTIFIEVSVAETIYRGEPVVLSYLRDVTSRKQTEEALRQSEERFRALVEKSWEVIVLYDKDHKRTYVSPTITKTLGYSVEEFLSMDRTGHIHPDDNEVMKTGQSYILANPGETMTFVNRLRHKDGSWRWIENSIRNLLDEPSIHSVVVNFHDVTDRKAFEEALGQSEKRFRALVEKSSEAVFLDDRERKRTYVTPSITRILGYSTEEFLSMDRSGFIHPDDIGKMETARLHILADQGETVTFINRVRHKDGSWRWVESTVQNLLDEPGVHSLVAHIHDITERIETEEALKESENKFKDLAEKSFVGIYIIQNRVFKYVNARFAEIHGYTVEEIVNKKTTDEMIFLEDLSVVNETTLARASGAVISLHYEFRIVTKAGKMKYIEVYGTRTIFQGKPATIGAVIDITERKRIEEALKKSEEKYRNIFENAVEGIFQLTPGGKLLAANTALARIFGYDSSEALMTDIASNAGKDFVNPEDRQILANLVEAFGFTENFETQFFRKDGEKIWVSISARAVRGKDGKTSYYEGTVVDITNRKLAEEALQESEAKYRNVIEHFIVGFYIIQDNVFRFVNRRFCEISGYSYEELVDKMSPLAVIHPDDRAVIADNLEKRMKDELDYIGSTFRGLRKDGQVILVKGLSNKIMYNGRPAVAGTLIDITKEQTLETQLRQAQKMEAVGTLAGGIAHDFNNILTAIIGYGRMLQMKMAETDPLKTYVEHMLSSSETAANLTRNLLAFSRKQIVELKPVNVGTIIKGTERFLKSLLTEDIELKILLPDPDITIMADMSQMEQVLINLASNANDAMPRGGTLAIEASEIDMKDAFVDGYDYVEPGRYVLISVTDTGIGIDEKTRDKIFEPFFTTKEVGKGTGLGLSIVQGIINQHHGYITVNTKPQGGTVFHVYLPIAKASVEETTPGSPVAEGGIETILIAEDDSQVRNLTMEILKSAGYTVIEAVDGEDAIQRFLEHSDTVELLLLDVVMPRKNGKEAYDEIRKINPDIRVVFMSGYTGDVIVDKGIVGKEYDFIHKPLFPNDLLQHVRQALDK